MSLFAAQALEPGSTSYTSQMALRHSFYTVKHGEIDMVMSYIHTSV